MFDERSNAQTEQFFASRPSPSDVLFSSIKAAEQSGASGDALAAIQASWVAHLMSRHYFPTERHVEVAMSSLLKVPDTDVRKAEFSRQLADAPRVTFKAIEAVVSANARYAEFSDLLNPYRTELATSIYSSKSVSQFWKVTDFALRKGAAAIDSVRPLLHSLVKSVLVVPSEISAALAEAEARFAKIARNSESHFRELATAAVEAVSSVRRDAARLSDITAAFVRVMIHATAREKLAGVDVALSLDRENAHLLARREILHRVVQSPNFTLDEIESWTAPAGSSVALVYELELASALRSFGGVKTSVLRGLNMA